MTDMLNHPIMPLLVRSNKDTDRHDIAEAKSNAELRFIVDYQMPTRMYTN
jgi:hypothetical protein